MDRNYRINQDANGSCEVKIGKSDLIKIKDCECSVEITLGIGKCTNTQCQIDQGYLLDDAKIQCSCTPECPEMLSYIM